ncbi:hypothetical protein MTO96_021728 [Rhipicephalus appendiculatus]
MWQRRDRGGRSGTKHRLGGCLYTERALARDERSSLLSIRTVPRLRSVAAAAVEEKGRGAAGRRTTAQIEKKALEDRGPISGGRRLREGTRWHP